MNPANYLIPILDMYCHWLNVWIEADNDPGTDAGHYDIHDFTTAPYGESRVHAVIPDVGASSAFPRFMVVVSCTNGDEGGDTDLVAWFEVNEDNTTEIVALCQGFDTNLQFIYEDRQWRNLPT